MKFFKRYWFHFVFVLAIIFGVGMAHWSYETLIKGWSPTMIVDTSVPSDVNPLGYEPVELTGKPVEQGVAKMITCKVPIEYTPYIHYPANWANSPFNPANPVAQAIKWALYAILAVLVGLLGWRIAYIVKMRKKIGGKIK
jgi:hypothetical protein